MRQEIVKIDLTPEELQATAEKLADAEKALSGAEAALDIAETEWKQTKKDLTAEVNTSRDEVHTLAEAYRTGQREAEVETDDRVKNGVIETFVTTAGWKKQILRTRPLESGDQATIPEGDDSQPAL